MRLMPLCVWLLALCGTPVDSAEANLLDYNGLGPCDVTLTPEEPCKREEDDSKCSYLFNVPPLTIHLPKQLRELERIVEELQMLKDNVDELRRMCADCTVRQTGREWERESDSVDERMNRSEEGRNWLNADSLKEFSPEHGTKGVTSGAGSEGYTESDAEKIVLEEKEKKNGGAERQSTAGVTNEGKRGDGKQVVETSGTFPTQREEQDKWSTHAGGRGRLEDVVLRSMVEKRREEETNDGKNDRNGGENSRGDRENLLENGEEGAITGERRKQEKTDDNDPHVSQDRTEELEIIKTQTQENRSSHVNSDFHGEHTNKRQQQHVEERKKEMEKGIKAERGNEKLKQAEGKDREKASRQGEAEEKKETGTGREIKTKGEQLVQRAQTDGDGGLASSRDAAETNLAPKGQTPSTSPGGAGHESGDTNAAVSHRSSHGPPAFSSLTSPAPWINKDPTTTSGGILVQTVGLGASLITQKGFGTAGRPTTAPAKPRSTTAAPVASFSRIPRPTKATTTTKVMTMATFPGVSEHHNTTARKNISSKTGIKPLPGTKNPKIKSTKINNSYNQGPLADKKPKHDQKQKLPQHKTVTKPRHKDPRTVQGLKPNQRTGNLPVDLNLKNTQTQKNARENATNQNLPNIQNSNSPQKPFLPAQRPTSRQRNQPVNNPDKPPPAEQRPKSTEIPNLTPNQKIFNVEKKRVHILKTERTLQKSASEQKPKPSQNPKLNQGLGDFSENTQTTNVTPQPFHRPSTELLETAEAHPLAGTTGLSSAQKVTPSPIPNKPPSQVRKTSLTPDAKLKPGTVSNPNHQGAEAEPRPQLQQTHTEEGLERPRHNQTPRRSSKPASERTPEAESSHAPLPKRRSHTRPAELPRATSADRSQPPPALKPVSKTETDWDPLKMTRATPDAPNTSQTNTLPPPSGSAEPVAGVNIHPAEVSSARLVTQHSKTYSFPEDGIHPDLNTLAERFPASPDSGIPSDLMPPTGVPTPSVQATTAPNPATSRILSSVFHESAPELFHSKHKNDGETKHGDEDIQIQRPRPDRADQKAQIPEQYTAGPLIIQMTDAHLKPAPPTQSPPGPLTDPPPASGETRRTNLNSNPAESNESEPEPDGGPASAVHHPASEDTHALKQPPPKPVQTPLREIKEHSDAPKPVLPDRNLDPGKEFPPIRPQPAAAQKPGLARSHSDFTTEPEAENKPEPAKTSQVNKASPDLTPDPVLKPASDGASGAGSDKTSPPQLARGSPSAPTAAPGATFAQKSLPLIPLKSGSKARTEPDPPQATSDPLHNFQMNLAPSSGPAKRPDDVTNSLADAEVIPDPKSPSSQDGQTIPHLHALPGDSTANANSRVTSRQKSQTTAATPSIRMTKSPNRIIPRMLSSVPPGDGPTQPKQASNVDSKLRHNAEETTKSQIYDSTSVMNPASPSSSPDLRSTSTARSAPEPPAPAAPTDSARELRVKMDQVAAFFNNSRSSASGRHPERQSAEPSEDKHRGSRPDGINSKLLTRIPSKGKACS